MQFFIDTEHLTANRPAPKQSGRLKKQAYANICCKLLLSTTTHLLTYFFQPLAICTALSHSSA